MLINETFESLISQKNHKPAAARKTTSKILDKTIIILKCKMRMFIAQQLFVQKKKRKKKEKKQQNQHRFEPKHNHFFSFVSIDFMLRSKISKSCEIKREKKRKKRKRLLPSLDIHPFITTHDKLRSKEIAP